MSPKRSFFLDENIEKKVKAGLRQVGYEAFILADVGLKGHSDASIFAYIRAHNLTLITYDKDYLTNFVPPHGGILVSRFYSLKTLAVVQELLMALSTLANQNFADQVYLLEPGKPPQIVTRPSSASYLYLL